jgi:hypothetical protein
VFYVRVNNNVDDQFGNQFYMSSYLTLAAGIIFLTIVLGIILPDGKLNKFINFIIRLICIFVLIQPITQIFSIEDDQTALIDYDYICTVYSVTQSKMLEELLLSDLNIQCDCTVYVTYDGEQLKETGVDVLIIDNLNNIRTKNEICEYLQELGYIDINVNEKDA